MHPGTEAATGWHATCQGSLLMLHWDLEVQGTRAGQRRKRSDLFFLSLSLLFVLSPLEWLLSHCGVGSLSLFRSSTAGKPCCGLFCTTQSSTRPPHPFLRPVVCAERITNARCAPLSSKAIARRFLLEFTSPAGSPLLSSHAQFYLLPSGDRFGLPSLCHGLST